LLKTASNAPSKRKTSPAIRRASTACSHALATSSGLLSIPTTLACLAASCRVKHTSAAAKVEHVLCGGRHKRQPLL